jgi:hypothetical protein
LHIPVSAVRDDANQPWIATDLAILHELTAHVGLEVELDLFSAVRTRDEETFVHGMPLDLTLKRVFQPTGDIPEPVSTPWRWPCT